MSYPEHLTESYGLPVFDFPQLGEEARTPLPEPDAVAWRISADTHHHPEYWPQAFARFTEAVDITRVRSVIVGVWRQTFECGPEHIIATLLGARDRLPALRALFLGDMEAQECEISSIYQDDVGPLLEGFPELEEFGVRGGSALVFPEIAHQNLRSLVIETGGMPAAAVRGVAGSDLPALEHLDLWLGTDEYGGDAVIADLAPILDGSRLPRLRHLGLRNSDIQDDIAVGIASAPVVARLETLDLSLGVLTDVGGNALLTGQPLTHLKRLDIHHNHLGEPLRERLREVLSAAGADLDADPDGAGEHVWGDGEISRYVAVGA
ncbi:STM4015 family protein [Streptomyces sp. NPDC048603]|uniref:STM4015 family protein n=1 Tax=Streptomyces sp. NPDC048603 TaxID=3365577 RepID=UPI003712F7E4